MIRVLQFPPRFLGGAKALGGALLSFALLLAPHTARADLPLDGTWRQSALHEEYVADPWQEACGPKPGMLNSGGGETIEVKREGDELSFIGGGRVYKTSQCYESMPSLARDSHSRDGSGRSFRTHCSTPPNDPRQASVQTVVSATDSRIDLVETGRYDSTTADGKCTATVKRTRSYTLISRAGEVASAAQTVAVAPTVAALSTTKVEPPRASCTDVGEPARLEVRPSKKLLRPGEAFSFLARVTDENGCATKTEIHWEISPKGGPISVDAHGVVTVSDGAPEGRTEVSVSAGEKRAKVTIEVASAQNYEAFLKQEGLNEHGELDIVETVTLNAERIGASEAIADDRSKKRRNTFFAIVGASALVLGGILIFLLRRNAKAQADERSADAAREQRIAQVTQREQEKREGYEAQLAAHHASIKAKETADHVYREKLRAMERARREALLGCPDCRREFAPPMGHCPHDGTKLVQLASLASAKTAVSSAEGGPASVRGVANPSASTVAGGTQNSPYNSAFPQAIKGKLCPTCGDRFGAAATFCGKDGTSLVPLN